SRGDCGSRLDRARWRQRTGTEKDRARGRNARHAESHAVHVLRRRLSVELRETDACHESIKVTEPSSPRALRMRVLQLEEVEALPLREICGEVEKHDAIRPWRRLWRSTRIDDAEGHRRVRLAVDDAVTLGPTLPRLAGVLQPALVREIRGGMLFGRPVRGAGRDWDHFDEAVRVVVGPDVSVDL